MGNNDRPETRAKGTSPFAGGRSSKGSALRIRPRKLFVAFCTLMIAVAALLYWWSARSGPIDRCIEADEPNEALEWCSKVISNADSEPGELFVAHTSMSSAYRRLHDQSGADAEAASAIALLPAPSAPEGRAYSIFAYFTSGNYEAARELLLRTPNAEEYLPSLSRLLGTMLFAAHDYQAALPFLRRQATTAEDAWAYRKALGITHYLLGDRAAALVEFRQMQEQGIATNDADVAADAAIWLFLVESNRASASLLKLDEHARNEAVTPWLRAIIRGYIAGDPDVIVDELADQRTVDLDPEADCTIHYHEGRLAIGVDRQRANAALTTASDQPVTVCLESVPAQKALSES